MNMTTLFTQSGALGGDCSILYREGMSMNTVRLVGLGPYDTDTTDKVLSVGYSLKMRGITASSISTQMVNIESSWDSPNKGFVRKSMGIRVVIFTFNLEAELAIAVSVRHGPSPTFTHRIDSYSRPDAFHEQN